MRGKRRVILHRRVTYTEQDNKYRRRSLQSFCSMSHENYERKWSFEEYEYWQYKLWNLYTAYKSAEDRYYANHTDKEDRCEDVSDD